MDERRGPARRRAVGGRRAAPAPATAPRSSASRTSSRSSTRSAASPRTASPRAGVPTVDVAVARRHRRPAPRLRPPRVRHPQPGRAAALRPLAAWPTTPRRSAGSTRCSTRDLEVNAAGRRRHRRPAGAATTRSRASWYHTDWVADRTIAWLDGARRRRRLVLLDELPRPAPPVGPAGVRARPRRLARRAAAGRLPRDRPPSARRSSTPSPATGALWYDGDARVELRGAHRLGAGDAHRRPGARGQRPQRRRGAS